MTSSRRPDGDVLTELTTRKRTAAGAAYGMAPRPRCTSGVLAALVSVAPLALPAAAMLLPALPGGLGAAEAADGRPSSPWPRAAPSLLAAVLWHCCETAAAVLTGPARFLTAP